MSPDKEPRWSNLTFTLQGQLINFVPHVLHDLLQATPLICQILDLFLQRLDLGLL